VGRLEVDHVVPLAIGGQESDFNRQLLCYDCHKLKSELERQGREVSL
jgi:5-methylcytosine-specific restriction protein A